MSRLMEKVFKILPFVLGLIIGLVFILFPIVGYDFAYFPGDLGDGRLNIYFLEHCHKFFTGKLNAGFWDAPFMYPEEKVISFSDNLLGSAPIFSIFRLLGCDIFTAAQGWFIVVSLLNYITAYILFNYVFKNRYAAVLGALVFAFSLALQSQLTHAQTFPRFAIPLTFYFAFKFFEGLNPKYFLYTGLTVVYVFYCGLYLGFLVIFPLLITFIILMFLNFNVIREKARGKGWILKNVGSLSISLAILLPLIWPYYERSKTVAETKFSQVVFTVPTIKSYLSSQKGSLIWDFISSTTRNYTASWDHQIFPGGLAFLSGISLLVYAIILFRKKKYTITQDNKIILSIAIGFLFTTLFFLRFGKETTLYKLLFEIPGFNSMRSMTRIINVQLLFFGFSFALVSKIILDKFKQYSPVVFFVLAFVWLGDNFFITSHTYRTEKKIARTRFEKMEEALKILPQGALFSYEPGNMDEPASYCQIDAMLASQALNLKTINAYTATGASGYNIFWHNLNEEGRNKWLNIRHYEPDSLFVLQKLNNKYSLNLAPYPSQLEIIMKKIRENPKWLEMVRKKALERNIPIDSMIYLDARWMIGNR